MLEGKNISFSRGERELFSGLTFSLNPGETLRVRGANGSGKSTFLRLLAGFLPLKPDQLLWKKEPVKKATLSHYQQHLLYGGHKLGLSLDICVQDQLCLWHRLYPLSRQTLKETLDFWGLGGTQHQKIIHLSQGQQKRLSLSRCSWMSRPLWILDEPEAGLDHVGQGNLKALMASHLKAGGMIVHATHQRLDDASGTIHEIVL